MRHRYTAEITVDMSDTKRALVQDANTGERYVVTLASEWSGQECVGARIVSAIGPMYHGDLPSQDDVVERGASVMFDAIDKLDAKMDAEIGAYLQDRDEAGGLRYPFGAR